MIEKNSNKRCFGNFGEDSAARYLEKNSYKIICRNYRVGRRGEIDIIATEGEYICIVEVKTRSTTFFGMPSESVNKKKQETLRWLAQVYLKKKGLLDRYVRFDVVEVITENCSDGVRIKEINLIKNAF